MNIKDEQLLETDNVLKKRRDKIINVSKMSLDLIFLYIHTTPRD